MEIKIIKDDDFECPKVRFIEFEIGTDKKLKKLNKRKWEKQEKRKDKEFLKIRKEIESR